MDTQCKHIWEAQMFGLKHLWYLPLHFITFYLEREHRSQMDREKMGWKVGCKQTDPQMETPIPDKFLAK